MAANSKGELIVGTVTEKAHQICKNAKVVLEAAGSGLEKVVKVTVTHDLSLRSTCTDMTESLRIR